MRFLAALLLVLALTACPAPAFTPTEGAAPGVTLTSADHELGTLYRVDTSPPLDRLFLRFIGENLDANAPECTVTPTVIECIVGEVRSFYALVVGGTVTNDPSLPYGVACRNECYALYLE